MTDWSVIPIESNRDDRPDMRDCKKHNVILPVTNWERLGLELGLQDYDIANISKDNEHNPNRSVTCCRAVLEQWLREPPSTTWGKLDDATKNIKLSSTISPVSTDKGDNHLYCYKGNMFAMLPKDAIKKFNVELMKELPLENPIFIGKAKKANLFPPGIAESIAAQPTRHEKVAYFLQNVVEPGIDDYLPKLLEVMKDSKVDNVVTLADEIQATVDPGNSILKGHKKMRDVGATKVQQPICLSNNTQKPPKCCFNMMYIEETVNHKCVIWMEQQIVKLECEELKTKNEELKATLKRLQKRNVQLENTSNELIQLVKALDKKLNTLSESFEAEIRKERKKYQRKIKMLSKEQGYWKEQYAQLKRIHELQSEHQKYREICLETRCEDLKKQNDDLMKDIAQFPKILETALKAF